MNKSRTELRAAIDAAAAVNGPHPLALTRALFNAREWDREYDRLARTCGAHWTAAAARLKASRIRNAIADAAMGIVRFR